MSLGKDARRPLDSGPWHVAELATDDGFTASCGDGGCEDDHVDCRAYALNRCLVFSAVLVLIGVGYRVKPVTDRWGPKLGVCDASRRAMRANDAR